MPGNTRQRSKAKFKELYLLLNCSAMPPLEAVKVLVSTMMSVGWSGKETPTISAARISKERPRDSYFVCLDQEHVWNSRCFSHLSL